MRHCLAFCCLTALPLCSAADRVTGGIPLSTLQLNGHAQYIASSNVIELTNDNGEASSAFIPTPYTFGPQDYFEAEMVYDAAMEFDTPLADGLTLAAQNTTAGPAYVGQNGSGLGYFSTSELPAVAATFDYISNQITGTPGNTVAIAYTQGLDVAQAVPPFPLAGTTATLRYVWVTYYNPTKEMKVYVSETSTKPSTPTVSAVLKKDLSSFLGGSIYLGVTAGTGDDYCLQSIEYFNVQVVNQSE